MLTKLDTYEANAAIIEQSGFFPRISSLYQTGASRLISHFSLEPNQTVLDVGSGTGILRDHSQKNYKY